MTALIPIYIHLFWIFLARHVSVFSMHTILRGIYLSPLPWLSRPSSTPCVSALQDAQLSQLALPLAVFTNHLFKTLIKHLTHKIINAFKTLKIQYLDTFVLYVCHSWYIVRY
jgi:hypothetical protein